jgi:hypothetical protein
MGDSLMFALTQGDERAGDASTSGAGRVDVQVECDERRLRVAEPRHKCAEVDDQAAESLQVADDEAFRVPVGDLLEGIAECRTLERRSDFTVAHDLDQLPVEALARRRQRDSDTFIASLCVICPLRSSGKRSRATRHASRAVSRAMIPTRMP